MILFRTGILLLVLSAGAAAEDVPSRGGPLRLALRHGSFEDPGVVQVHGARAFDVRRMWFGENESPAVAPGEAQGMTVAVPPGAPRTRVRVRAEMADGRVAGAGTFRYDDPLFPRGTRHIVWGSGAGCTIGASPDLRYLGAATSSSVERLKDGTFLFTYAARHDFAEPVTIRWDTLLHLGYPGGLAVLLAPGETFVMTRAEESRPVLVEGVSGVDRRPDCPSGSEEGTTWAGHAYLPAATLPSVGPLRNVRVFPTGEGSSRVVWDDPASGPPDRVAITVRYVKAPSSAPRGKHLFREYVTAPGATSAGIAYVREGVVSVFLRPIRDGYRGEGVLAYAVH